MEYFNTYYNQTLHIIKANWKSWTEGSSLKRFFNGFIYSFVYNCIMHFYIRAVNEFETFQKYWKTLELHSSFTSSSSNSTMIQQKNESASYYEQLTSLYQPELDFFCPPEMITKCAFAVTSPDKKQRLINFSDRVKQDWTIPHQFIESNGEIRCAQIRTGKRDYTMILFYFFIISLFLNVIYGIYQRRKYEKSQNNNASPPNQAQENVAPSPRGNPEVPRGNQEVPLVRAEFYDAVQRNDLTASELARLEEIQTIARLNQRAPDRSNSSRSSTSSIS